MKKNFKAGNPDFIKKLDTLKSGHMKTVTWQHKIVLCVIFSCSLTMLQSQAQKFQIYNTENSGLPHNQVQSVAIDAQGNKWFGLAYGKVVKFDDVNWTVYDSINSALPPGNYDITTIAVDALDYKWVGTGGGGLVKFKSTLYNDSNSGLPNNDISGLALDKSGNKWISTRGGGVAKFDNSNWTTYNSSNSDLPDNWVSSVAIDDQGNKWFSTQTAIAKYDNLRWTIYKLSESIIPYYNGNGGIISITMDEQGNKWFGIGEDWDSGHPGGVAKFDDENWTIYTPTNSGLPYGVHSTAIDKMGNIWFAISYWSVGALVKFDGTTWTVYDSENSGFPNDGIRKVTIDEHGNKWLATWNSGIVKFNENGITTGINDNMPVVQDDFTVYPNPAKDQITIQGLKSGTLEVFNSSGKVVKNSEVKGMSTNVDISNLPNGIYIIRVMTKDNSVVKKFIKEN